MMTKHKFKRWHPLLWVMPLFYLSRPVAHGQQLVIENTRLENGHVILDYSIADTIPGRHYTVRLYSSNDNFLKALSQVQGDEGIDVQPGKSKTLSWDPHELGAEFIGSVALELKARPYIPFVQFQGFESYQTIKRTKPYTLTWSGGSPQNILNFEMLRKGVKVAAFPNIANVGHYDLILPRHIKPGRYQLRITDSKNRDEVVVTKEFAVKRKVPLVVKTIPVLLAGLVLQSVLNQAHAEPFRIPDPILPD